MHYFVVSQFVVDYYKSEDYYFKQLTLICARFAVSTIAGNKTLLLLMGHRLLMRSLPGDFLTCSSR